MVWKPPNVKPVLRISDAQGREISLVTKPGKRLTQEAGHGIDYESSYEHTESKDYKNRGL
jgi:hypothetical protein